MTTHGKGAMPGGLESSIGTGPQAPECLPALLPFNPALPDAVLAEAWRMMASLGSFQNERGMAAS